jgi:two-component system OmpR family response regulator
LVERAVGTLTPRVLVVDDDAAICELLETVLTRDGCTVDTESDPTKAEARVRAGGYHLLLLDVMMPQQDGLETLRRVRALDRDLAVVMITGFPSVETAVQAMQMEAMDYLRKPFTVEALREVVTRVLRRRGLAAGARGAGAAGHRRGRAHATPRLGLTLKDLGRRAELSVSQLSQVERGEGSASVSALYRLAVALGVPMKELFGDL